MGLGYPGGPAIQRLAEQGERGLCACRCRASLPVTVIFISGLKTAFAQSYNRLSEADRLARQADYTASLQDSDCRGAGTAHKICYAAFYRQYAGEHTQTAGCGWRCCRQSCRT